MRIVQIMARYRYGRLKLLSHISSPGGVRVVIQRNWTHVFNSYLPSNLLLAPGALQTGIGITGPTLL